MIPAGIAGLQCQTGLDCLFPTPAPGEHGTCGAADQGGTCVEHHDICPTIVNPVCGAWVRPNATPNGCELLFDLAICCPVLTALPIALTSLL